MRNYKKYRSTVLTLFADFLAEKETKSKLIYELIKIQRFDLQGQVNKTEKSMWFKFFKGDTGATTINDLSNYIDCRTNREYIIDHMQIAIDNPKGFQIYYS